jgi:hypothetical protein
MRARRDSDEAGELRLCIDCDREGAAARVLAARRGGRVSHVAGVAAAEALPGPPGGQAGAK